MWRWHKEQLRLRGEVLQTERTMWEVEEAIRMLGLEVTPTALVRDVVRDQALGKMVLTFQGTTVCVTCMAHRKCKVLLPYKPALGISLSNAQADALAWLAAGATMSATEHQALSVSVRRDFYRMKVR